jgi:hypothetical protein
MPHWTQATWTHAVPGAAQMPQLALQQVSPRGQVLWPQVTPAATHMPVAGSQVKPVRQRTLAQRFGQCLTSQPHCPFMCRKQRPVGPAIEPSGQV